MLDFPNGTESGTRDGNRSNMELQLVPVTVRLLTIFLLPNVSAINGFGMPPRSGHLPMICDPVSIEELHPLESRGRSSSTTQTLLKRPILLD